MGGKELCSSFDLSTSLFLVLIAWLGRARCPATNTSKRKKASRGGEDNCNLMEREREQIRLCADGSLWIRWQLLRWEHHQKNMTSAQRRLSCINRVFCQMTSRLGKLLWNSWMINLLEDFSWETSLRPTSLFQRCVGHLQFHVSLQRIYSSQQFLFARGSEQINRRFVIA